MITRILELVHQINEGTPHDAFFEYSGHVGSIDVRINDANTTYKEDEKTKIIYKGLSYFGENEHLNGTFGNITLNQIIADLENFLKEERNHATA